MARECGCGRRAAASVTVGLRGADRADVATFWCRRCLDGVRLDRVEAFLRLGGHRPVIVVRAA